MDLNTNRGWDFELRYRLALTTHFVAHFLFYESAESRIA